MENTLDSNGYSENKPNRPSYLTTLCILTWIGCAWFLYQGIKGLKEGPREQLNQMAAQAEKESGAGREAIESVIEQMAANMETLEKWQLPGGIISILGILACAFGAFQMWELKKSGFMIYVLGEWIPVLFMTVIMFPILMHATGWFGLSMKLFVGFSFLISLTFTLMYRANLKHMR